jgi:uncharacterized protein (TIGR02996 family)
MLRLMVTVGVDEWVFGFPQDEVVIGAAPASGLVLDHATVAANHAKFCLARGDVLAEGIEAPLIVNDRETRRTVVREGDVIEIGAYRLGVLLRDPPGRQEQDFLDAIARAPGDDAPRVVYSDWLEEKGRHDDAELLRAQVEIRTREKTDDRFMDLSRTIQRLAPRMSLAWRRAVARPAIENCSLQFEVQCPKTWDELAPTEKPDERFCKSCSRHVHYATTIEKARRLAIAGQCVSVDLLVPRYEGDLHPRPMATRGMMVVPPNRSRPRS